MGKLIKYFHALFQELLELKIYIWDMDELSSNDIIGIFDGILDKNTISRIPSEILLLRRDLVGGNKV